MRATVFRDAALAKQAGRFVWLSIDTEDAKNAPFLERYPFQAVPTFDVIDGKSKAIAYQWIGAVDAGELVRRFDEAEHAYRNPGSSTQPSSPDAEVVALSMANKNVECADRALALLPGVENVGVKANVAGTGLDCALSMAEDAPNRKAAIDKLEAAVREAVHYDGLLDDDRSGLYGTLVDARERQKDEAGAKAAAAQWMDWLDEQAKAAPSAEARAALDGYRVDASRRAGTPERALAPIQASQRDLPADYNPPARLAIVLREMGRYDEALRASDLALSKVYGPRTLTVLDARAKILEKKGDTAAMKTTLQEAVAFAATLPASQRPKGMIARIEKRLGQVSTAD